VPQVGRVCVGRDPQNRLPAIQLKIHDLYDVTAVLSTGDPTEFDRQPGQRSPRDALGLEWDT